VLAVDLDTFLGDSIEEVDFIFMDVEGSEIEAIKGMRKILDRSPNVVILAEWSPKLYLGINKDLFYEIT
jgi:FkbM family methyltransferase